MWKEFKETHVSKKVKLFFRDSMWSIAGLMMMNMAAQFLVYPVLGRTLGSDAYGNVLTLISFINILSVAVGSGCNYARMRDSSKGLTTNGEYNVFLLFISLCAYPFAIIAQKLSGISLNTITEIFFVLLMCAMLWRYYGDVDFRLSLDYRGFFYYYLVISIGYIIGIWIYIVTDVWPLALLPGELLGLLYVGIKGRILKKKPWNFSAEKKQIYRVIVTLVSTNLLLNFIFNADRLLLNALVGGTAVTLYYLASLIGKTVSLITTPMNGVIIGYAARYNGKLTKRMLFIMLLILSAVIILAGIGCTLVSNVLIAILYPLQYELAKPYFVLANLSQIIYCANNVLTTFLLCFTKSKYQFYINVVYALAFLVICVPVTLGHALDGFVIGLLMVNVIRFIVTTGIGMYQVFQNQREETL